VSNRELVSSPAGVISTDGAVFRMDLEGIEPSPLKVANRTATSLGPVKRETASISSFSELGCLAVSFCTGRY